MATMNDRGQILLVGAIVIAVSIVALSVLLSGGIFAETMARNAVSDIDGDQTHALVADVRSDGEWILDGATSAHPASKSDQAAYVRDNVTTLAEQYRQYYARSDSVVRIGLADFDNGTTVSQSSGPFTFDANGDGSQNASWQLASDTRVRNASFTVTGGSGTTQIIFNGSTDYTVEIDSGGGVRVVRPSGSTACPSAPSTPVTVDLGNATVAGDHCPALDFGHAIDSPYDVWIEDGDQVEGAYHVTVDDDPLQVTGPNDRERVYAVDLVVRHRSNTAEYHGTVRVAPEEV